MLNHMRGGLGKSCDRGGIYGAGTHETLLPTPVQNRGELRCSCGDKRTDAHGTANFMPGDRHRIDPAVAEVNGYRTESLHRIRMHGNTVFRGYGGNILNGLYSANFIICPHNGN